jgi:D-alanyl-D-alanine carboxypeptidase
MSEWQARARARDRRVVPPRTRSVLVATALAAVVVAWLAISAAGRSAGSGTDGGAFAGPLGPCRIDDVLTPHRDADDWARTLLDPEFRLAADDVPPDLVPIGTAGMAGEGSLRAFVLDDLASMAADAAASGARFRITSAYRSHAHQVRTFGSLVAAYGRDQALRGAARPGHSEHQLGTTIDVAGGEAWLADESWRYGFVVSYPLEHSPETTCYKAEPWHLRYVGREAAAEVRRSGLSLRAWLWARQTDDR